MNIWLSERQAAAQLGISPAHLHKWRVEKMLNGEKFPFNPVPKPATNNRIIYAQAEITSYNTRKEPKCN